MRIALLALLLACHPHEDDTGDTGDTDTGDTDTADTGDTDTGDTADTVDTAVCPDADGDGYCDAIDTCDGPGADDADGDGTCDDADLCFGTGGDGDTDGVCDNLDDCTGDDASGDLDGDGTCDDLDECYGVGVDGDGDGLCDDVDLCSGDNTTGDDDFDGVCDGSDPCVSPGWCWNMSFTITSSSGSGFENVVGQTLIFAMDVGDDHDWDYSSGSLAVTQPLELTRTGSNAAAQTLADSLAPPHIRMLSSGAVEIDFDVSAACQNSEKVLTYVLTDTGWGFDPIAQTVSLGAGTPATTAQLRAFTTASCPGPAGSASGVPTFIAIDGFGPP